jgi:hypothetical protein
MDSAEIAADDSPSHSLSISKEEATHQRATPSLTAADIVAMRHASSAAQKRSTIRNAPTNASDVLDRLSAWDARREESEAKKKAQMALHMQLVGSSLSSRLDAVSATPSPFTSFKSSSLSPRDSKQGGKGGGILSSQPLSPSPRPRTSHNGNSVLSSRVPGLERVQLDLSQRPSGPSLLSQQGSGALIPSPSPRTSLSGRMSSSGSGPISPKVMMQHYAVQPPAANSPANAQSNPDSVSQKVTGHLSETVSGRFHTSILGSIIGKGLAMQEEEFREFMSYSVQAGRRHQRTSLPSSSRVMNESSDPIPGPPLEADVQELERGPLGLMIPEAVHHKSNEAGRRPSTAAEDIAKMMRWKGGEALKGQLKKEAEEALAKRRSLTGEIMHPAVAMALASAGESNQDESRGKNPRTSDANATGRTSLQSTPSFVQPDFRALLRKRPEDDPNDLRFSTTHKLTRGTDFAFQMQKKGGARGPRL